MEESEFYTGFEIEKYEIIRNLNFIQTLVRYSYEEINDKKMLKRNIGFMESAIKEIKNNLNNKGDR